MMPFLVWSVDPPGDGMVAVPGGELVAKPTCLHHINREEVLMKRRVAVLTAGLMFLAGPLAGVASAHYIEVNPPGDAEPKGGWVGAMSIPGKGQGLITGGPPGQEMTMTPAHAKGLNTACESIRANGNGVVDIYGPPSHAEVDEAIGEGLLPDGTTSGCAHGALEFPED